MIGDLRWIFKKIKNKFPKNECTKVFKPYVFKHQEINTNSSLKKCVLTINKDGFGVDDEVFFHFKDILNIELIKTIIKISNKGWVVQITLNNSNILCFSFGQPELLSRLYSTNLSNSYDLFLLLSEKWNEARSGDTGVGGDMGDG